MAEWSVQNVRDTEWWVNEKFGAESMLVPQGSKLGARMLVLEPGKPSTLYHRESGQEGFLVIQGECLLVIEQEERPMRAWDYFHCPPGTTHSFVGAGDGPCVMVTVGLRGGSIHYARDETALRHGAGLEEETDSVDEAYAPFPAWEAERPAAWADLPWNR